MSCIDKSGVLIPGSGDPPRHQRAAGGPGLLLLLALAGCSNAPAPPAPGQGPAASTVPSTRRGAVDAPSASSAKGGGGGPASLGPPRTPRSHAELKRQAAQRLVAANPERSYMGTVPDVLLAIPVLEVELTGDGHVRHIKVLRRPGQALDTVQLAMDAVHRAAPFGNVSSLPKPWVFSETFLFNDQRRFKPRSLDE